MVKAMFVTKIKSVLTVVLIVGLTIGGIGTSIGLSTNSAAVAQQPGAKTEGKAVVPGDKAKKADEKKPAEKERKVLTPDEAIKQMPRENVTVQFKVASVERTAWYFGYPATYYVLLKDGGKFTARLISHGVASPKEDRILRIVDKLGIKTVDDFKGKMVRVTGRVEHDSSNESFRMFVRDPADIELVEEKPGEKQPMAKEEPAPKNAKQERKVLTPEEAIKQMPKGNVTVQFKVASVRDTPMASDYNKYYPAPIPAIILMDGGQFAVSLAPPVRGTIHRLGIDPVKHFTGKVVRVTGVILQSESSFYIQVSDLNQFTVVGQ
jgi:hypothetical protein